MNNRLPFYKIHGCGNSMIIVFEQDRPGLLNSESTMLGEFAKWICDASWGVGSDGLMVVGPVNHGVCHVGMRNPDGSLMGMCGNGIRTVMRSLYLKEGVQDQEGQVEFVVQGRKIICSTANKGLDVRVDMGKPSFTLSDLPASGFDGYLDQLLSVEGKGDFKVSLCSMGNPHCVIFDDSLVTEEIGPLIEKHKQFPEAINVEFVKVLGDHKIHVSVWERGAGITQACGTGACASAVLAIELGRALSPVDVELPGGILQIEWQKDEPVIMTGPTELVAQGDIELPSQF